MTLMMIMMEKYLMSKHIEDRGQRNVLILDTSSSEESQECAGEDVHSGPEAKNAVRYL